MFGDSEVNFTSSNVLPKPLPDMSEGNISSLLHWRIQWKLAASFPKVPSYSEPQEFPGFLRWYQPCVTLTKRLTHPQNAPPIFSRVLYIYFLHYSWGVDCSLAWISWREALPYLGMMSSLPIPHIRWVRREGQREGRIGAWMDGQIGKGGGEGRWRRCECGGGRGREGWREEGNHVTMVEWM